MGYDYEIHYRAGAQYQAADALSRCFEQENSSLMNLSVPCPLFLVELRRQLDEHPDYRLRRQEILADPTKHPEYTLVHNLILRKGRIWLPKNLDLIPTLLVEYHTTPTGGHIGIAKIVARLMVNFDWPGLCEDVMHFVSQCLDCQHVKYETKRIAGLLCPLPVPHRPWEDCDPGSSG